MAVYDVEVVHIALVALVAQRPLHVLVQPSQKDVAEELRRQVADGQARAGTAVTDRGRAAPERSGRRPWAMRPPCQYL